MQLQNKIIKTELVEWKNLRWFQPETFKTINPYVLNKLKTSLIKNGFAMPFTIWENKDTLWILDGHYRHESLQLIQSEGIEIPDLLPANFIDCKDKKEAKKIVLLYNSHYSKIDKNEFINFTIDLNHEDLIHELNFDNFDITKIFDNLHEPLDMGNIAETGFQYDERKRIEEEANRIAKERFQVEKEKIERETKEKVLSEIKKGEIKITSDMIPDEVKKEIIETHKVKDNKKREITMRNLLVLEIHCENENELEKLFNEMTSRNYECKILTL